MKNIRILSKRGLALLLALVMCLSLTSLPAFAEEGEPQSCIKTEECAAEIHDEDCPKYVAPAVTCTVSDDCAAETHEEGCPLYVAPEPQTEPEPEQQPELQEPETPVVEDDNQAELPAANQVLSANTVEAPGADEADIPQATAEEPVEEPAETNEITGEQLLAMLDENGVITLDKDYALTSLMSVTSDMTIDGNGYTITKADTFNTVNDTGRSWYNPAMIEVHRGATVTLTNITLEDSLKKNQGGVIPYVFKQAAIGTGDNTVVVQDAIIATYDGDGHIVLDSDAKLKGFAGMSAVRITGDGATFTMKYGSSIEGGGTTSTKDGGGNGAAGAVWMQGGTFTMEAGAEIKNVTGRAVYVDGGNANIDGTISNITASEKMWQGTNGVAIHLRGKASATVSGTIKDVGTTGNGQGIILYTEGCDFTLTDGGTIKNCHGGGGYGALLDANHGPNVSAKTVINGKITECSDQNASAFIYCCNAINGLEIGENADISNNTSKNLIYDNSVNVAGRDKAMVIRGSITGNTVRGCVFYGGNNGRPVELYGQVNNNTLTGTGGVFSFGANRSVAMKSGSEIKHNTVDNGAVVAVNGEGNTFTMEGGEISGNSVTNGAVFSFIAGSWQQASTFEIKDGTVSGNTAPNMLMINSGKKVASISSYLLVPGFDHTVYFAKDGKNVTVNPGTKLGDANENQGSYSWPDNRVGNDPRSVAELNAAAKTYGLKDAFATFWAQNANGTPVSVKMEGAEDKFDAAESVYVLAQAVDEKGKPDENAEVFIIAATVAADGTISFNLPGNENGYAVGLAQLDPDAQKGTLTLTVDKAEVKENDTSKTLTYTATFKPSTENPGAASTVVEFSSTLGNSSATLADNTATWSSQLNDADFKGGQTIDTVAILTITIDGTEYKVLSNTASTRMVAYVAPNTYTVTFNWANGGTVSYRVEQGRTVTAPSVPAYTSGNYRYTFSAWSPTFNPTVTGNATYTAQYTSAYIGGGGGGGGGGGTGGGGGGGTVNIEDPEVPLARPMLFEDVHEWDWFYDAVYYVFINDYMSGYSDYIFAPNDNTTRGMIAQIVKNLSKDTGTYTADFIDVPANEWYASAVGFAASKGYVSGYSDTLYGPTDKVTREQLVSIFYRYAQKLGLDVSGRAELSKYADGETTSDWAKEAMRWGLSAGLLNGYAEDNTIRPQNFATRAEIAQIIKNFCLNIWKLDNDVTAASTAQK